MSYQSIIEQLPEELRPIMLRLLEAVKDDLREEFAARRMEVEHLQGAVGELSGGYEQYEQRFTRLDTALAQLAEAQERTEQRMERFGMALATLIESQERTEQRMERLEIALAALAEAQERTEQRMGRLEIALAALAEAQERTEQRVTALVETQERTEQRMGRLEIALAALAEAQERTEQRMGRLETVVAELGEAQKRTEVALSELTIRVDDLTRVVKRAKLDELAGFFLEQRYRERAGAYLGSVLRKVRVIPWAEIEDEVDERLPENERSDLLRLDLLVRGKVYNRPELPDLWVALEISGQVDEYDVVRAQRRAASLRRLGYATVPAVAGEEVTDDAELSARAATVMLIQNGAIRFWEEALANVTPA